MNAKIETNAIHNLTRLSKRLSKSKSRYQIHTRTMRRDSRRYPWGGWYTHLSSLLTLYSRPSFVPLNIHPRKETRPRIGRFKTAQTNGCVSQSRTEKKTRRTRISTALDESSRIIGFTSSDRVRPDLQHPQRDSP